MNRTITIAPVRKTVTVNASQEVAFETFVNRIGAWWPKDHSIGKSKLKDVRIEPQQGGRAYEIGEDGVEVKWGTVLTWDPYSRLVFTWQITSDWQPSPNNDTKVHSEVDVRFIPEGANTTRVELEHRNFERMGAGPGNIMRESVDKGWPGLLQLYAKVANGVKV